MDVILLRFGDILRDLLEERNLSQKQMAEDLNISASAVGNYVRNNREPDFETLKKIAGYFQVSTDFLLDYQSRQESGYGEQKVLQIFRALPEDQKELYIEQGRLLIRCGQKKKERSSLLRSDPKAM
jgi:transcriptional regulator with XRE-family HTH domain